MLWRAGREHAEMPLQRVEQRLITRRHLLAGAATIAGMASAASAPFVSRASAYAELKIVQWRHVLPGYDAWFDGFARDWGARNGIDVTVDHIGRRELSACAAAEARAESGHDIIGFTSAGAPHLYAKNLLDLTRLVEDAEKKYGKVEPIGRQIAYHGKTETWLALPDFYAAYPGLYRKDLWDDIGIVPDAWEKVRTGGAKLKAKGSPVGIRLGRSDDLNATWRGVLWSFGASVADATGAQIVVDSPQAVEAVKYVRALYREAVDPSVLSSDTVDIGDGLAAGRISWISNPMSTYRKIQKTTSDSADNIAFWKTPMGPVRRLIAGAPNSYGVWQFAQNRAAAVEFLKYYLDHWVDAFAASTGFNCPLFPNILPEPVPILSFDPTSDPPDKLDVLKTASEWDVFDGYPGPALGAVNEVADEYVICDMMAHAASGQMTPEDAVKWASEKIRLIYKKSAT